MHNDSCVLCAGNADPDRLWISPRLLISVTLLWATYLFSRSMLIMAPPPEAMPPSHSLYGSGAGGAGGATLKFPDGDGGEGRASVCEESHDSERGWVICSCPFITFIKVWGEDTCSLSDLFCQSRQWWESQLGSLLQLDPGVNIEEAVHDWMACLTLEALKPISLFRS